VGAGYPLTSWKDTEARTSWHARRNSDAFRRWRPLKNSSCSVWRSLLSTVLF